MAHRSLIFALLAICLFYVIQASPMPQNGAQPAPGTDTLGRIQAAAGKGFEAASEGLNAIINDPALKQLAESASRAFQEGVQALTEGAKKLVPKTE